MATTYEPVSDEVPGMVADLIADYHPDLAAAKVTLHI